MEQNLSNIYCIAWENALPTCQALLNRGRMISVARTWVRLTTRALPGLASMVSFVTL
eukprot:UN27211